MSFKYRLRFFFLLLTVVPLLGAAYAVHEVFSDNRLSRTDTLLATALAGASAQYEQDRAIATSAAESIARDREVQQALAEGDAQALVEAIQPFQTPALGLSAAAEGPDGSRLAGDPPPQPGFRAVADVRGEDGRTTLGRVVVGFPLDAARARRVSSAASSGVAVGFTTGDRLITANGERDAVIPLTSLGPVSDARLGGDGYRLALLALPDVEPTASLVAFYPSARIADEEDDLRIRIAVVVAVAIILILLLSELVLRSITGQLGLFARRAREVGEGRFAGEIPVHGNDEFALFASAFNDMSTELARRIDELETERLRVARTVARFGQALESTHDVTALLTIVVESAMEGVRARGGRLLMVDEQSGALVEHVRLGTARGVGPDVLAADVRYGEGLEGLALQTMRPALQTEPRPAVAAPLQSTRAPVGLLTLIDPEGGSFAEQDAETLQALAQQGAIAIDNARLHRQITKQASTDGLTGLANHREFQDQLRREIERAQRFALPLALVLVDLDDFKLVNDRFGHLAGDSVLRSVAATVRSGIREIDCAARYGGEEFAVVLPGTTAEGAARLAERLRVGIAERTVATVDGQVVAVTASFGVAAMPEDATTQVELIGAADDALYRAKEGGKNRVAIGAHPRELRG